MEVLVQVLDQFMTQLVAQVNTATQAGAIMGWAGTTAPSGWLICDNEEYNQTKYEDLYEQIGQTFGGGAGTFRVPGAAHLPVLPSGDLIWIIRV